MSEIREHEKEKLIVAILCSVPANRQPAIEALIEKFGPIDYDSGEFEFSHTHYYDEEMGSNIKRSFVGFQNLVEPSILAGAKVFTNSLEERFHIPGTKSRSVNLDPGLISLSKLVLASAKNFSHRIFIGQNIYAEVTLKYSSKGGYLPLEWTFPDYATPRYREIMEKIREIYKNQL